LGHKVHPLGFRIGVIHDWQAKWYADKHYIEFLHEDLKLREAIRSKYAEAGISQVQIDRQANKVSVTIHTARPGIVIGRGGQRVDEMRLYLEELIGKRIQLNIQEIQQPELDAYLVAKSVAEQIERRVAYRRAMKQAVFRVTQAGAKGIKISCAGRLGGAEIARRQNIHQGQVPLHTLRADIDYGLTEARTTLGRIGVKVWIYKGDILAQPKLEEVEEIPVEAEAKPVEAEAKPAKAKAKPAKEEVKPAKAKTKPAEAEAKPAEAEAKPAEVEAKPAKAEAKPAEAEVKPAEAETKPARPKRKPAKAEAKPVLAEVKPAEAEVKPAEAEAKPAKPKRKPAKAEAKPAETEVKPSAPRKKVKKEEKTDATAEASEISQEP